MLFLGIVGTVKIFSNLVLSQPRKLCPVLTPGYSSLKAPSAPNCHQMQQAEQDCKTLAAHLDEMHDELIE